MEIGLIGLVHMPFRGGATHAHPSFLLLLVFSLEGGRPALPMLCFLLSFPLLAGWGAASILLTLLLPSFWLGGAQHPPYSIVPFQFLDCGGLPSIPHHALPPSLLLPPPMVKGGGQHVSLRSVFFPLSNSESDAL